MKTHNEITTITNDGEGASYFSSTSIELEGNPRFSLSAQQAAVNFRLRSSDSSYQSDWHVAGDPTLLIILQGTFCIELRNGESKIFNQGEMFIAEDYLKQGIEVDEQIHGHRGKVESQEDVSILHLKLRTLGI